MTKYPGTGTRYSKELVELLGSTNLGFKNTTMVVVRIRIVLNDNFFEIKLIPHFVSLNLVELFNNQLNIYSDASLT